MRLQPGQEIDEGWIKDASGKVGVRVILRDTLKGRPGYSSDGSFKIQLGPKAISTAATGQFARGVTVTILHEILVHGVGDHAHWHSAGYIDADKGGQLAGKISKECAIHFAKLIGGFGI